MTLGCGESATEATDAGPADAAAARGGADAAPGDDFAVGQPRAGEGGRLRVAIVSATPAPPARNLNDWTIAVSGADGQSLAACTVAVGLFMPAHGHTSTTEPVIRAGDDPSTYQVDDMNLFMPGRWEITFDLVCGEVSDQVLFGVEIAR
jgi:hypothetical protein